MQRLDRAVDELVAVFSAARDKRSAHEQSRSLLEAMSAEPAILTEIMARHLRTPGALNARNYPVVAMEVESNPYFVLVANVWIPLPDARSDLSTKAIHHHGNMLLSTANAFGPGYEHWLFTRPEQVDESLYRMNVISHERHALHTVAYVDAWVPHLPVYPASTTVTLALWSNSKPMSWRDRVKRMPMFRGREKVLKDVASKLGLTKALDLKVVENFDYHPVEGGFRNIQERIEFALGPNEDHLHSLFHVIQKTGNESLATVIEDAVDDAAPSAKAARALLADLKAGREIAGRLSEGHYTVPFANFTTRDIERSVSMAVRE